MERKHFHKDEEAKNRKEVRNKMTGYLLLFYIIPKTSVYFQERIKADARPQDSFLGGKSVGKSLSKQVV